MRSSNTAQAPGHAEFSPSSISRLFKCPGAHQLSKKVSVKEQSSPAAERGTAMHGLGGYQLDPQQEPFSADDFSEDEQDIVAQYVEYITKLNVEKSNVYLFIESKVQVINKFDCWGTADAILIYTDEFGKLWLHVVDLKTGYNIVSPESEQLYCYALGALKAFNFLYDFEIRNIRQTIVQPRNTLNPIATLEYTANRLAIFESNLTDVISAASKPDCNEFNPGIHCRFCKALPICGAAENAIAAEVKKEIDDLSENDDIPEKLELADLAETWIGAVRQYAMNLLLSGETIPGRKLVQGRSLRKWDDTDIETVHNLLEQEFNEEAYEKKYLTVAQTEKKLGKREFAASNYPSLVVKSTPKLTIALESDKRPAVINAAAMFEDLKN